MVCGSRADDMAPGACTAGVRGVCPVPRGEIDESKTSGKERHDFFRGNVTYFPDPEMFV